MEEEKRRRRGGRKEEGGRVERKRHRIERGVGDSGVIVQFDTCILLYWPSKIRTSQPTTATCSYMKRHSLLCDFA